MSMEWITKDEAERTGTREEQVLIEQSPGHYQEFQDFITKELRGKEGRLYFRGKSGSVYTAGLIPQREPDGLQGMEICIRISEGTQIPASDVVDLDLWPFFEWIIQGVGGEWDLDALRTTGSIYNVPSPPERT